MPLTFGPRLQAFLAEPLAITVGTTRRDGSVQMVPVWHEYRDGQVWINAGGPRRDWLDHLRRDPRVTLFLIDPKAAVRIDPERVSGGENRVAWDVATS